jgi:hypothetical protein
MNVTCYLSPKTRLRVAIYMNPYLRVSMDINLYLGVPWPTHLCVQLVSKGVLQLECYHFYTSLSS